MIDIDELRRLARAAMPGPDGVSLSWIKLLQDFQQGANPAAVSELLDHLEETAKDIALKERIIDSIGSTLNAVSNERDVLRDRLALESQENGALRDSVDRACEERDELRTELKEVRHGVAVTHDTIKALRAKVETAENDAAHQKALAASALRVAEGWKRRCGELRAELETERTRLAACGVVALANTPDSAKQAREMRPEYWSASCGDVARMVDENIKLRAMIQVALVVLDEVCGNINPERGYADELETDVKRAIATLSLYNAKGE